MALVRIVANGEALLEKWASIAPGKPRRSAVAREELINRLTQYFDSCGTPITVVLDGAGASAEVLPPSTPDVEIEYTRAGQPLAQTMYRLLRRFRAAGDVLAVTEPPEKPGQPAIADNNCLVACSQFIATVEEALQDLERNISTYNKKEQSLFKRTH